MLVGKQVQRPSDIIKEEGGAGDEVKHFKLDDRNS